MKIRKYSFSNLLLYLSTVLIMLLIQHIGLFGENPMRSITLTETIFLFSCSVILLSLYFAIEIKNKSLKIIYPLLLALIILFILGIVSSFVFPEYVQFTMPYEQGMIVNYNICINLEQRVINLFVTGGILLFIYIVLGILPQKIQNLRQLNLLFYILVILSIVAIVYSLINDIEGYKLIFNSDEFGRDKINSFTNNANNYAAILFFGVIASLFLNITTKNKLFYIATVIFAIAAAPTLSRTYLICIVIVIYTFVILRLILTIKVYKKRNTILLSLFLLIPLVFVITFIIFKNTDNLDKFALFKILDLTISRTTGGVNGRTYIWEQTINFLSVSSSWVLGCGFYLFSFSTYQMQDQAFYYFHGDIASESPHNGLLQMVGNGGIVFAVFVAFCLAYLVFANCKNFKKNKEISVLGFTLILAFAIQMITEAPAPLTAGVPIINYCLMSVLIFVPFLSVYYNSCHHFEYSNEKQDVKIKFDFEKCIKAIEWILSFVCIILCGLILPYLTKNPTLLVAIILLGIIIVLPLIISVIKHKSIKFREYLFDVILGYVLPTIIFIGIGHILIYIIPANTFIFVFSMFTLPLVFLTLYLFIDFLKEKMGIITDVNSKFVSLVFKYINKGNSFKNELDKNTLLETVCSKLRKAK